MSLLKATEISNKHLTFTREELRSLFLDGIDNVLKSNGDKKDVAFLICAYTRYSVLFLREIAQTLEEPKDVGKTMDYMNSYIAEALRPTGIPYYNIEQGRSLIDNTMAHALDNDGLIEVEDVLAIMDDAVASLEAADKEEKEEEVVLQ